jgi:hypothetical protein
LERLGTWNDRVSFFFPKASNFGNPNFGNPLALIAFAELAKANIGENGAVCNTGQNEKQTLFYVETNFKLVFAEK